MYSQAIQVIEIHPLVFMFSDAYRGVYYGEHIHICLVMATHNVLVHVRECCILPQQNHTSSTVLSPYKHYYNNDNMVYTAHSPLSTIGSSSPSLHGYQATSWIYNPITFIDTIATNYTPNFMHIKSTYHLVQYQDHMLKVVTSPSIYQYWPFSLAPPSTYMAALIQPSQQYYKVCRWQGLLVLLFKALLVVKIFSSHYFINFLIPCYRQQNPTPNSPLSLHYFQSSF